MPSTRTARIDSDLALAAELQAALLPRSCPSDCPNQAAAARNRMCGIIGGDFYDFLRINQDQIALVIGDVVGHGIRASLLMAKILGWLRSLPENIAYPARLTADLNRMLIDLSEKTDSVLSCSLIYGVIDTPTGMAFFVNCGHPHAFICNKTQCSVQPLGGRNMLLGIEEFDPNESCHQFKQAERMILYTDGITDAINPVGKRFGEPALHSIVSQHASDNTEQCADAIFQAVEEFRQGAPQEDDETIVVFDRL